MIRITAPAADPERRTRCTSLQRLLQDSDAVKRLSTACLTPVYLQGRYAGAFGSSLTLGDFLSTATRSSVKDATALLLRSQGDVLAYPGIKVGETASSDDVDRYEKALGLRELMGRIQRSHAPRGEAQTADGRWIVAYGRIPGPDWYLLLAYPKSLATMSAMKSAAWILLLGLLASGLQTWVILRIARRKVIAPLQVASWPT